MTGDCTGCPIISWWSAGTKEEMPGQFHTFASVFGAYRNAPE